MLGTNRKKDSKFEKNDEFIEKMISRILISSDEKIGRKFKIDEEIADRLDYISIEKGVSKEDIADDILNSFFSEIYNIKLKEKVNNIDFEQLDIVIDKFQKENINRVNKSLRIDQRIAKLLKLTSVQDKVTQGEVFEKATAYYFKKIYDLKLKHKLNDFNEDDFRPIR